MAAGARDAQSAPTCLVGGRAAAHSTQRQPALEQHRAIARICTCRRSRTRCAQRHSSGKRTICPATRHARRGNAAEIERLGPRRNGLLHFQAKGGKLIEKEIHAPRLANAIDILQRLPGRRLFQYRDTDGAVHTANAREVNQFLRGLAEVEISLKDFRTLLASVSVLEALARAEPATK